MKISQLVLRENFYEVLNNTIQKNGFVSALSAGTEEDVFMSYQYLNVIISKSLSPICRKSLVHEYTLSPSKLKSFLQKTYVFIVFIPYITNLFVHKRLKFPAKICKYAIVGGNHRIRLFDDKLKNIVVLLKIGENVKFLTNDIETRLKNNIGYAPKITSHGNDWLVEDFVSGVPLNRIDDQSLQRNSFEYIVEMHMKQLIYSTKNETTASSYFDFTLKEIESQIELIVSNNLLKTQLLKTISNITQKIRLENFSAIETSITHGDFQRGNIRITPSKEVIVLDWESADRRFYLYDLFTILSGIREGNDLLTGLSIFLEGLARFDSGYNKYTKEMLIMLLCFENLRFYIFEDISVNYFEQGKNLGILASEIDSIIYNM